MVVSKLLTNFCYFIRLILYLHLNSYAAYPGISPESSNYTTGQYQHLPSYPFHIFSDYSDQSLTKLVQQKNNFRPVSHWNFTKLNCIAPESPSMDAICDMIFVDYSQLYTPHENKQVSNVNIVHY